MKKNIILFTLIVLYYHQVYSQQQFIHTVTKQNINCNNGCSVMDIPELNKNPGAIIFVTPVEGGVNVTRHPIGAYYMYLSKWSIFNLDGSSIVEGTKFNVEYYAKPGPEQYVQVVERVNQTGRYYIDHPGLDNNPGAQVRVFPTSSPINGALYNRSAIKIEYDASVSRWFIANINNEPLVGAGTAFNIAYSGGANTTGVNTVKSTTEINTSAITNTGNTNNSNNTPFSPFSKADHSGQRVFVSLVGNTQGAFLGENGTNRMEVTGFEMEGNSPRDMATGQATGRRQLLPVSFQKALGAASMQFFKAYKSNEHLTTVTFEIYEPNPTGDGTIVMAYKIVLNNASISNFKQSFTEGQKGFMDAIKLVYQSVNISYTNGGWFESDTWIQVNQ
ncbi:MAG TPA: type VI secretion system tube protein Hcp [Chitinophagaceae bacterium]|nr:type VI secretion system tube protein Hcp [Chitinophagaceae bacterium]